MLKEKEKGKEKNVVRSLLTSVRLTIGLLALIALAAALGTLAPSLDVYHSAWFSFLLGALSLNLAACSAERFPSSWRRFKAEIRPDRPELFRKLSADRTIFLEDGGVAERVEKLLQKGFRKVGKKETAEGRFFCAEKGAYSHFGVYVVHAGVLVIIAGAMIGAWGGFTASVNIVEGESVDAVHAKGEKGSRSLGFNVRLDRFTLDFYDNGMPKTYRSDLTFTRDGKVIHQGPLLVNHPISLEGLRFYQASYGTAGGGEATLMIRKGSRETSRRVHAGDILELPGEKAKVKVLRIEEDLMQMGPAVKIEIQSAKGTMQFWVFQYIEQIEEQNPGLLKMMPQLNPGLFEPYLFVLQAVEGRYFSGIQVARDPGAPVVAGGSVLLVAGLIVAFFSSHRRIWVRVDESGGRTRVSAAGLSSKDAGGLDREIRRFLNKVRERSSAGS